MADDGSRERQAMLDEEDDDSFEEMEMLEVIDDENDFEGNTGTDQGDLGDDEVEDDELTGGPGLEGFTGIKPDYVLTAHMGKDKSRNNDGCWVVIILLCRILFCRFCCILHSF